MQIPEDEPEAAPEGGDEDADDEQFVNKKQSSYK